MTELRAIAGDGADIRAFDEGRGPAVLIVHPGGGDATTWDAVAGALAERFRVVRIRRRIYDRAVPAPARYSVATEAADVLAVAGLLDPPVVLVGHSSGAVAALEAARLDPTRFARVIAYEPPMPTDSLVGGPATTAARAALDSGDPVEAMRIHLRDIVRLPAHVVEGLFADEHARAMFAAVAAAQVADDEALDALGLGVERFRRLDLPVTLIAGAESPTHLGGRIADLAAVLPQAAVVTLAGQGHVANLLAPDTLAGVIGRTIAHGPGKSG